MDTRETPGFHEKIGENEKEASYGSSDANSKGKGVS